MRALFADIPLGDDEHVDDDQRDRDVAAGALPGRRRGAGRRPGALLAGTTQNDIIKEYLSRGTYVFPPGPSLRLITDMVAYTVTAMPKWNPINICSYHLQEAGATPVQEIAYALCTAIAVLDAVQASGQVPAERFGDVCARISFFVNAGVRFVEEMCKMRAFGAALGHAAAGAVRRARTPKAPALPLRGAGQLARADRGAAGEQRPADRAGDARRDAVARTPGPARSSCRPGTRRSGCRGRGTSSGRCGCSRCSPTRPTCWSTTTCSPARSSSSARWPSWSRRCASRGRPRAGDGRRGRGGRERLHEGRAGRLARRAAPPDRGGEDVVVGVNRFTTTAENPLLADLDGAVMTVDPAVEAAAVEAPCRRGGRGRDAEAVETALQAPARRGQDRRQADARDARLRPGRGDHRGVGRRAARGVRGVPRAHRRLRRAAVAGEAGGRRRGGARRGPGHRRGARRPAALPGRQARASTGTATAPSRSPSGPGTAGSRWSTRASG